MGGLALLALGGLVALAASAASSSSSSQGTPAAAPRALPGVPPPPPTPAPSPASQLTSPLLATPAQQPAQAASAATPTGAPSTAELVDRLQTWLASDPPPAQVELVAARLEEGGMAATASQLRAWAQRSRERGGASPSGPAVPAPGPTSPAPSPRPPEAPPAAPPPTGPVLVPAPPAPRAPAPAPAPVAPVVPLHSASDSGSGPAPAAPSAPSPAPSGVGPSSAASASVDGLAADTAVALQQRWTEIQTRLRAFQREAGLTVDGQYGPLTRAALRYWTGRSAPRPWTGSGTATFVDPERQRGDRSQGARNAERRARALFSVLIAPEGAAAHGLRRFQEAAGLSADGRYGALSRAALQRHGVANPPPTFRRSRR